MTLYFYLVFFLLLVPVQASLLAPLSRFGLAPDLGMAVLYFIGLLAGPIEGALAGVAVGLLLDIASAGLIGFSGITRGIVGLAAGYMGSRILDPQSPSNMLFLAFFSLAEALVTMIYLDTTYGSFPILSLFFGRMLPRAVVTALAGYWLLRLIMRRNVLGMIRRRELQKEF